MLGSDIVRLVLLAFVELCVTFQTEPFSFPWKEFFFVALLQKLHYSCTYLIYTYTLTEKGPRPMYLLHCSESSVI